MTTFQGLDYACGKGTFMRSLATVNDDLHNVFPGSSAYDPFIKANAAAVWKNRDASNGHFPYYWDHESPEPAPGSWGYNDTTAQAVLRAASLNAIAAGLPWLADQSLDTDGPDA